MKGTLQAIDANTTVKINTNEPIIADLLDIITTPHIVSFIKITLEYLLYVCQIKIKWEWFEIEFMFYYVQIYGFTMFYCFL